MSTTWDIVCVPCHVSLWIGQSSGGCGPCVYSAEPATMDALGSFLADHAYHELVFRPVDEDDPPKEVRTPETVRADDRAQYDLIACVRQLADLVEIHVGPDAPSVKEADRLLKHFGGR